MSSFRFFFKKKFFLINFPPGKRGKVELSRRPDTKNIVSPEEGVPGLKVIR